MDKTTTELTVEYIKEHPYIKACLKKELINYSSLARYISKELKIEKKTSKEAILIAARRFQQSLKKEQTYDKQIKDLFADSEIFIRNKIAVLILEKNINLDVIDDVQKKIRKETGIFYILEGTDNYTIITQEKYSKLIENKFKNKLIKSHKEMALIDIKSSEKIEDTPGAMAHLTALFAENGVNILEFLSCWKETLLIVDAKDVNKSLNFLKF